MTWVLKHKRSDRPMIAEYLCPVHGRFELTVERDANGNPPDEAVCPANTLLVCLACSDESCRGCPGSWRGTVKCSKPSPFAISAPGYCKVKNVEAVRGGYEKAERPTWTDTTNLGEGQDVDDWWDDRAKVWERQRESEIKELANG